LAERAIPRPVGGVPVFAATKLAASGWGYLPLLSLVATAGLLAVACANIGAKAGAVWAEPAFFVGLIVLVVPIALRLLAESSARHERIALVVLLAIGLFVCKVLRDPLRVGSYDEFLHVRTVDDILRTGALFSPNTLLGVSPYYPGLELLTAGLSDISGTSPFDAGTIALVAARLVFALSLFLFFESISGSARVAGIASLVYMTNPKFLYFNAQFSYETLGLPLAAFVLYLLARRGHSVAAGWVGLTIIALVALPSVVITHHVTSAMLTIFLVVWGIVAVLMGRRDRHRSKPGRLALYAIGLMVAWTLLVANATIGYLGPAVTSTISEMVRLMAGELDARGLFVSRTGEVAPLWERIVGSASAGVVFLLLPLGLIVIWRRYRSSAGVLALGLIALTYPATLLARLTRVGAEVSSRTPEFLFLSIGLVVGLGLARLTYRGRRGLLNAAAVALLVSILAVGGVLVGVAPWARLPGPYLVSADARSIEQEGIGAAEWARDILGPDQVMVADRVNRLLMSAYGSQTMITTTTYQTRLPVRRLYLATEIGTIQREIIRLGQIQYLVTDQRLTTEFPVVGHYFDRGEESIVGQRQTPLDPLLLSKFDRLPEVHRIFDSGNIQIYDVSGLALPAAVDSP